MVLLGRIELPTSPLPRECSTSELQQHCGRLIRLERSAAQEPFHENGPSCAFLSEGISLRASKSGPSVSPAIANSPYKMHSPALDAIASIVYTSNMENKSATSKPAPKPVSARDARLKAALKANLGRRKQLSRAKAAADKTEIQSE